MEEAVRLVGFFFTEAKQSKKQIKCDSIEFYATELIAKGLAIIYVTRCKCYNDSKKNEIINFIKII